MRIFAQVQNIHLEFEKKKNGYEIISYAHKFLSNVHSETRLRLLQQMVNHLLGRSFVDKVYVPMSNYASSPFNERDLDTIDEITGKLEHVIGSTPDRMMLRIQAENSLLIFYLIGDRYARISSTC